MKEQQQVQHQFPLGLTQEDRLFLQMLVIDGDTSEAKAMANGYGVVVPEGGSVLETCGQWLKSIQDAEKHHCQNILDLHSQGKSIGGMQAQVVSVGKEQG